MSIASKPVALFALCLIGAVASIDVRADASAARVHVDAAVRGTYLGIAGEDFFRPVDDSELEEALERLIDDQRVQFDLRPNLKLECQLKRYRTPDDDREVGMKVELKYRF